MFHLKEVAIIRIGCLEPFENLGPKQANLGVFKKSRECRLLCEIS